AASIDPAAFSLELPTRDPAEALRRAIAIEDAMAGAERFAAVARDFEIIADHAMLLRADKLRQAQLHSGAAATAAAALERYDATPLRPDFYEVLGNARAQVADEEGARDAWTRGIRATRDSDRQAALRLRVGESLERGGQLEDAAAIYRRIWSRHATSEQAEVAETRLDELEKQPGVTGRAADDWRRRADQLFRKRHNEAALGAYDQALAGKLKKSEAQRAQNQRAHTLFRMRRYPEAVRAFTALPQNDDVPLWRARSLARSGEVPKAVGEFEKLAKKSNGELSVRATYLAGLLLDGRGHVDRAQAHFDWVSRNRVSSGLSNAALWRLGWGAFRSEKNDTAIGHFERLLSEEEDAIGRLRTRYWRARALERAGDEANATAEFTTIANDFPFSYYGWRARDRIRDHDDPSPGLRPDLGNAKLRSEDLLRPKILLAAGLDKLAIEEMRRMSRRARGLSDRLAMAQLFSEAEQYHDALRIVVDAYTEDLARGPVPQLEELWWHAWPSAFKDLVAASTRAEDSVEPALVYAIMREESGYRPKILSVSGARGLLQIMVPTGDRLADRMGETQYEPDDLFEPETNIKLGAYYLAELMGRFDGRRSAAIASYNAGPNAVEDWLAKPAAAEDDLWVEAIPYDQTRGYVKRVLRSYHAYRVLY
ncbi:MAG: transglycosylase SLT domain-containing protein, partial [bacterium]|nr:transglycosylase SLT domain-containing protein [bacterium]